MGAKLEAEVGARERNTRMGEAEGHEEHGAPGDWTGAEESISALGDLFADLKFALSEEDPWKAFEFLNHAWKIAAKSN